MARRGNMGRIVMAMARESARQARLAEADARRREREAARNLRELQRQAASSEKEAKRLYLLSREEEVAAMNAELSDRLQELQGILSHTLTVNDRIEFDSLKLDPNYPSLVLPDDVRYPSTCPTEEYFLGKVPPLGFVAKLLPWSRARHEQALDSARQLHAKARSDWESAEEVRLQKRSQLEKSYEDAKAAFMAKVEQRRLEVEEFRTAYFAGDPDAIVTYNQMVLERSEYPEGFPQEFRIAYLADSRQLVIDYEFPGKALVPAEADYKYVKSRDAIEAKLRKATEIRELYEDALTATCLRTVHEVLEADQGNHLDVVVFSGFVQSVDPSTGKDIKPYVLSLRTTRDRFQEIDLSRIEKKACLRNLGAQASPRPDELQPVKPVVEFNMVDKRFIDQANVLEGLDARPNLMDLSPSEFEHLVGNLFSQMSLETRMTRSTKDGGVDVVAFDTRPIVGGKVVIQAKRYKNTVGVSAVRDLYGTMMNEGANKGLLVATSSYGKDAYEFSKDKPIELIDGGTLLYLLEQIGVSARIIMPVES